MYDIEVTHNLKMREKELEKNLTRIVDALPKSSHI